MNEGVLKLGENELNCYVLNNSTRLISQNAVFRAFGRGKRGIRRTTEAGIKVPSFMDARNLEPFIDSQLGDVINPIEFKNNQGQNIFRKILKYSSISLLGIGISLTPSI